MNQPTRSDEEVVSRAKAEAGSFLAVAVSNALREKDTTIDDLRREAHALREAITGLRQFATVETMTPEQRQGYELASKDLLLLASPVMKTNWNDLPPLGWGEPGNRSQLLEKRALKLALPPGPVG